MFEALGWRNPATPVAHVILGYVTWVTFEPKNLCRHAVTWMFFLPTESGFLQPAVCWSVEHGGDGHRVPNEELQSSLPGWKEVPGTLWPWEPCPYHSDLQTLWYEHKLIIFCMLSCWRRHPNIGRILSLTGGQKARVVFAELACRQPDVLILVRTTQTKNSLTNWKDKTDLVFSPIGWTHQQFGHWVNRCLVRGHQWVQRR